jgi:hypothetical protein
MFYYVKYSITNRTHFQDRVCYDAYEYQERNTRRVECYSDGTIGWSDFYSDGGPTSIEWYEPITYAEMQQNVKENSETKDANNRTVFISCDEFEAMWHQARISVPPKVSDPS